MSELSVDPSLEYPYSGYLKFSFNLHKPVFWHCIFMHTKRISQKTGSITHASIKPFLAQETLVLQYNNPITTILLTIKFPF